VRIEVGEKPSTVEAGEVTYQDLRFGSDPGLPLTQVRLVFERAEFISKVQPLYDEWIREVKADPSPKDEHDPVSCLGELGYPPLDQFLAHSELASKFFCDFLPVETLFLTLGTDRLGKANWVISNLTLLTITEGQIIVEGQAFEKRNPVTDKALQPKIFISNSDNIEPGFAVLGAAHAALAWRLRFNSSPYECRDYIPSDFIWVQPVEFDQLAAGREHVLITESKLGHEPVALLAAQQPNGNSAPVSKMQASSTQLKMYILLKKGLALDEAVACSANAAVRCYDKFKQVPAMHDWAQSTFNKVVCEVSDSEFETAMQAGQCVEVYSPSLGEAIGLGFCPREAWPKSFRFLQKYRGDAVS
jgi:hypothetical protein